MTREHMIEALEHAAGVYTPTGCSVQILDDIAAQLKADGETIARLTQQRNDTLSAAETWTVNTAKSQVNLDAALARVAELEAALTPFAAFCETVEEFIAERAKDRGSSIMPPTDRFRLADFRRAREALKGKSDGLCKWCGKESAREGGYCSMDCARSDAGR